MGWLATIFLTHRDDVGDHAKWASHFDATRILHEGEVSLSTEDVEVKLSGEGPWDLEGRAVAPPEGAGSTGGSGDDDGGGAAAAGEATRLVFTPGHTSAHVCLYYAPEKVLFTGDHLSASRERPEELHIFLDFNWYDVSTQLASVSKLLDYNWLTVLPGHGRRWHGRDAEHRLRAVAGVVERRGERVAAR
ncbi:hypothetical protein FOA52_001923 [Chlamydomonas sp. UWO 241]|nr:hypothetical protein FOA52_001923 [Chlamydomonas sp. UWO 241]